MALAVRALIDSGAVTMPAGVAPKDIQVTPDTADPSRVTLSVGGSSQAFRVDASFDDALRELPALLEREAERTVVHLNELLQGQGESEPSHPQW